MTIYYWAVYRKESLALFSLIGVLRLLNPPIFGVFWLQFVGAGKQQKVREIIYVSYKFHKQGHPHKFKFGSFKKLLQVGSFGILINLFVRSKTVWSGHSKL